MVITNKPVTLSLSKGLKTTIMKSIGKSPMQSALERMETCKHTDICVVTVIPTDGTIKQTPEVYVECENCKQILNIRSILQRTIEVPLIK